MSQPGIEAKIIGATEAACVVAREHPLARLAGPVGPADLGGWPFISDRLDSSFEAGTIAAVCQLVATTGGVAIIPCTGPALDTDARLALLPFRPVL
jgi:DNA-binding transcriptional LysR family regulator